MQQVTAAMGSVGELPGRPGPPDPPPGLSADARRQQRRRRRWQGEAQIKRQAARKTGEREEAES